MSEPARICRKRSAVEAVRVKRGSTTIILALRFSLGLDRPLEAAGMVLGRIAAHDQHHVGVLDVDPAIGHRPASECWSQT